MLRRFRIPALVAGGLLALYALAGFLLVPYIARSQAIEQLKETYGLDLAIGKLRFNPFTLVAEIEDLDLKEGSARLLSFRSLHVDLQWRSLFERAIVFRAIALERPFIHAHLRADGTLNLATAFAGPPAEPRPAEEEESSPPAILVEHFRLAGGELRLTDESEGRQFDQRLTPLDLQLEHFTTRPGEGADLTRFVIMLAAGGRIEMSGDLSAIPARFDIQLRAGDLPLPIAQPYVPDTLAARITDGRLSFDLAVRYGQPGQATLLSLAGGAEVRDLAVAPEGDDVPVIAWESVALGGLALDLEPALLRIDEIVIRALDTGLRIHADGDTNIARVLRTAADAPEADEEASTDDESSPDEAFPFSIGRVVFEDSILAFRDEQIRPTVDVRIHELGGELTGIESTPGSRMKARLKGVVGGHGSADIAADTALFASEPDFEATVRFANVEMTDFSPYAGRFAGYRISKGKMFLDLDYTLVNSRIRGENHALFDQFELGERVDSEDATSLPVKFALSLLRDRHGKIDLRLPVEGDVNAPGFRFGHLIGQALLNVLTKIVTSPFTFLAETFGGGPEMEYAAFEPGSTTLAAAERDKFGPLAKALAERPRLVVEILGQADPEADREILSRRKLDALLAAAGSAEAAFDGQFGAGAAEQLRGELAEAAAVRGAEDAGDDDGGGAPSGVPGGEETTPPVDPEEAFRKALIGRLLETQQASDEELVAMALERGRQVMDLLVKEGGVDAARVFVRHGVLGNAGEGTRTQLSLDTR